MSVHQWLERSSNKILRRGAHYYRGFMEFSDVAAASIFLEKISDCFPEADGVTFKRGAEGSKILVDGTMRLDGKKFGSMVNFVCGDSIVDGMIRFAPNTDRYTKIHEQNGDYADHEKKIFSVRFGNTLSKARRPRIDNIEDPLKEFPVGTWLREIGTAGWNLYHFARVVGKSSGRALVVEKKSPPRQYLEGVPMKKYIIPEIEDLADEDKSNYVFFDGNRHYAHARRGKDGIYLAFAGEHWRKLLGGEEIVCHDLE